jgi:hypothetical protein
MVTIRMKKPLTCRAHAIYVDVTLTKADNLVNFFTRNGVQRH